MSPDLNEKKSSPDPFPEKDRYEDEARRRWDGTEAWSEYERKSSLRSAEQNEEAVRGLTDFFVRFGELKDSPPDDPAVRDTVAGLQQYITEHFYTCTDGILSGLGKMYSADGRFRENIDRAGGPGAAEFASCAIEYYCKDRGAEK